MTKFIEKSKRPKATSEAERQWIDEQGDFGNRFFVAGDDVPTNNVFSLDYYRSSIQIITIPYRYDEQKGEYVQDEEET